MGVWMETLKLLMQREAAGDADAGGGGAAGAGRGAAGVSGVMAYTALRNPAAVDNAISEQRQAHGARGARSLALVRMGLTRWPFGVSDRTAGRAPWVALETVHLSHNLLRGLPLDFYGLTNLTELRLDDNRVASLSTDLGRLARLRVLWLHQNRLEALPREAGRLAELETLTLNGNRLRGLPYELGALSRLRDLPLGDNPDLASPPPEVFRGAGAGGRGAVAAVLAYLNRFAASAAPPHRLDLAGLWLAAVPGNVAALTATADLDLSGNRLAGLPEPVLWDARFGLPRHLGLTRLSLARNALEELPPVVARLARLRELDVSGNPLRALPLALTALASLTRLAAAGAPLELPPPEAVAHGVDSVAVRGCRHHPAANAVFRVTAESHGGRPVFAAAGGPDAGAEPARLYCGGRNGATYWCVGPAGVDEEGCWLRALDAAARPADVAAAWDERGPDGVFRESPGVSVAGLGVMSFLRRVAALATAHGGLAALRAQGERNEGILQAARKVQAYLELRAANQAELARRAAALALDLGGLLLRSAPATEWGRDVRVLRLDGNRLRAVPECVFGMAQLESASLRDNGLRAADGAWRRLRRLRELRLDRNHLAGLPASLGRLAALEALGLAENELAAVPECVAALTALRELALARNLLRGLPGGLSALAGLTSLDLSLNDADSDGLGAAERRPDVPAGALAGMTGLRALRLDGNAIAALPAATAGLTALTALSAARNGLVGGRALRGALLGAGGGGLALLSSLDLSHNKIAAMDFSLRALAHLADVGLAGNELDHVPLAVHSLPALRALDLSGNFLAALPPAVGRLSRLETLAASRNQIAAVAPDLRRCAALATLDLSHNRLRHLPPAPGMPSEVGSPLARRGGGGGLEKT